MKKILIAAVMIIVTGWAGITIGNVLLEGRQTALNRTLFSAVEARDLEMAEAAIRDGAEVNGLLHPAKANGMYKEFVYYNHTPLIAACRMDDITMVELLIAAGADVNLADPWSGVSPLEWTLTNNKAQNANRFLIGRILVDHGADVNAGIGYTRPMESVLWSYDSDSEEIRRQSADLYAYMLEKSRQ